MTSAVLTSGAAGSPLILADFPESAKDLPWAVVNDDVMGGRSEGDLRLTDDSLLFTGVTNTRGGGFSSIRSRPHAFDLGAHDGVRLRVRGDGRTYTFRLTTSDTRDQRRRPSYWADFETREGSWEEIDVPFDRFRPRWRGRWLEGPPLDPAAVDSLGLMIYDGRGGPFRLEVDWIGAYRETGPFSMSALRWRKRPLLLFAPDEQDPRLREQLAAVESTLEGFRERDMELVVVLGKGSSRAGGQPLPPSESQHLRKSYGVAEGAFALRLVGKDGGVKRRGDEVVPMEEIYTQIDAMPMRQQEMRRE